LKLQELIVLKILKFLLALCLLLSNYAQADWFEKIKITSGLGTEYFYCRDNTCGDFDVGNGVIGKFSIWQSIYSERNFSVEFGWDHFSDIETEANETPIDYFGLEVSYEIGL
jgi:hypothetical protein